MKEQLAKELLSIINLTKDGIIKGVEIAGQQAPDLIEQLLRFSFWSSFIPHMLLLFGTLLSMSLFIVLFKIAKKSTDWTEINKYEVMGSGIIGAVASFGAFIVSLALTGTTIWLKVLIAPKIYLIEYLSGLIK